MSKTTQFRHDTCAPHRMTAARSAALAACAAFALALPAPTAAQVGAECSAPPLGVDVTELSLAASGTGQSVVLHVDDRNPAALVSGYNVYRSSDPSLPRAGWELVAVDAVDEDDVRPLVQLTDPTPTGAGPTYWVVTALNGPCSLEGPWSFSTRDDADGDGIGADDDPCPSTPRGSALLTTGCSATDFLLRPEALTGGILAGIQRFRADNEAMVVPDEISRDVDLAESELGAAADQLLAAAPCDAAPHLTAVATRLTEATTAIGAYLATLPGGAGPAAAESLSPAGTSDGTDGPHEWPSDEVLHWQGQQFALSMVADEATKAAGTGAEVCAAQGTPGTVEGRVISVSDNGRLITLASGERIVMARSPLDGSDPVVKDIDIGIEATDYGAVQVGTFSDQVSSNLPFQPVPQFDECLKLRVLPLQPYQPNNWVRLPLEGYQGTNGRLELEAGMRMFAEDTGCPGVFQGAGPQGEDLRLDYFYELKLDYIPKAGGNPVLGAPLAQELSGGDFVPFPDMNPTANSALYVTLKKRTCLDSGLAIPIIDPYSGNVVGSQPLWSCSAGQTVDSQTYLLLVRDPQSYCQASYADTAFDIEDDQPQDWRTTVVSAATPLLGVPGPATFSAVGDPINNGQPLHGHSVVLNQLFAVYNRHGHWHAGFGTTYGSGLDWPHITGTRNGQPYQYSCSVPRLVRDRIDSCSPMPDTYFRLPFPGSVPTTVGQGNGGSFTHNGWQWFALDLSGSVGDPLRAARGGKVVRVRKDMNLNCMTQTCTNWGFPLLDEYGNHVAIQHDDGTVGWYAHMVMGSSPLYLGQYVKRGALIGQLGNTGNSSGPHVHIHTTPESPSQWGNTTIPISYEAYDVPSLTLQSCFVPQQGSIYVSSNTP